MLLSAAALRRSFQRAGETPSVCPSARCHSGIYSSSVPLSPFLTVSLPSFLTLLSLPPPPASALLPRLVWHRLRSASSCRSRSRADSNRSWRRVGHSDRGSGLWRNAEEILIVCAWLVRRSGFHHSMGSDCDAGNRLGDGVRRSVPGWRRM